MREVDQANELMPSLNSKLVVDTDHLRDELFLQVPPERRNLQLAFAPIGPIPGPIVGLMLEGRNKSAETPEQKLAREQQEQEAEKQEREAEELQKKEKEDCLQKHWAITCFIKGY